MTYRSRADEPGWAGRAAPPAGAPGAATGT